MYKLFTFLMYGTGFFISILLLLFATNIYFGAILGAIMTICIARLFRIIKDEVEERNSIR